MGTYRASVGQAAALVFYVFCGLASTALVLSIAAPGGSAWYALTALSPLAGVYYWQRGTREEEFLVRREVSCWWGGEGGVDLLGTTVGTAGLTLGFAPPQTRLPPPSTPPRSR